MQRKKTRYSNPRDGQRRNDESKYLELMIIIVIKKMSRYTPIYCYLQFEMPFKDDKNTRFFANKLSIQKKNTNDNIGSINIKAVCRELLSSR